MDSNDNSPKTQSAGFKKAASYIALCFFASFDVCFFIPMDIFLANAADIAFPIKPLILFMGLVTIVVFAALFLVCMLTKVTANRIFRSAIFGISAAFYIQGNFLAVNMGQLNGSQYELPVWKAAVNIVIWLVILAAPFFILIKFPNIFESAVTYIPAAILLIQVLTLGISSYMTITNYNTLIKNEIFDGDTRWICTTADLDLYSENKNFILIVADEYDSFCFDSAVADAPDSVSEFDGFVYYTNTVGKFNVTLRSLAYIFSHNLNWVVEDPTFFETVSTNYKANFYCDNAIPLSILSNYGDNIDTKKIVSLLDTRGYAGGIYKITFFRCMPEVLKPFFHSSGDIGQELRSKIVKNTDTPDYIHEYSYDNLDFYGSLPRELRTTNENIFKYMYILGLHDRRSVTRNLERAPESEEISPEEAAVAVNKIVNEYLKMLKDNGMYDNSEIIFMADHGHYYEKKYPMLMYKPANQTETGIKISNAPISYDDMFPTLVMLAGGEPNERTIFDIGEDEERIRHYITTDEDITVNIKEFPQ